MAASSSADTQVYCPTSIEDVDGLAAALAHMQAVAYANDAHFDTEASDAWSDPVWFLQEFLRRRQRGSFAHAYQIVEEVVLYKPWQWRSHNDYRSLIKDHMKTLIKLLLSDPSFVAEELGVQVRWVMCLNHHCEERNLLCKFVLQGSLDLHKVAYQPQGRLKSTKYAKVSYKTFSKDQDLLDRLG